MRRLSAAVLVLTLSAGSALAQRAPESQDGDSTETPSTDTPRALPSESPGSFKPAPASENDPDVWIFSGALQGTRETFSATLVAKKGKAQFEMKLANGATCDGESLSGEPGLIRLNEITCTDDRTLRALFVPQGGQELKVFGHVGDERFVTSAHLLGTEPIPEKKQTAEPTAPAMRRPGEAQPQDK